MEKKTFRLGEGRKAVIYTQMYGIEYVKDAEHPLAEQKLCELEEKLTDLGFECKEARGHKWDPSLYMRIGEVAGFLSVVKVETYLHAVGPRARLEQSVLYNMEGLDVEVRRTYRDICRQNRGSSGGVYTCR